MKFLKTSDRFDKKQPYDSDYKPRPTRNIYSLFGDGGHDLFRHGLAEITPIDDLGTETRLDMFDSTVDYLPGADDFRTAKEDPVMFGFDIVIRAQESPLFSDVLQDSVSGFFNSIADSGNEEMLSRNDVWINFKSHFFQFFRDSLDNKTFVQSANDDNPTNSRFYYYLKKVSGLEGLVESNSGDTIKSFVDYGKDMIKLEFSEDVTLRVGRMAQLYKTLSWSRLSGKTMIPENLLRFDCDIVVSEVRNFVKVKKIIDGSGTPSVKDLQVLKDNVNRYVYTLYECQLFFDKMPHPGEIDLGAVPDMYTGYSVGFTYKFSTLRMDSFNLTDKYVPLNNGTYNPFSITPLDKFLNVSSNVESGSQSISNSGVGVEPVVEVNVIKYGGDSVVSNNKNTDTNSTSQEGNSENTGDPIEDAKENDKLGDSIETKKKSLLDEEIKQFTDAAFDDPDLVVTDHRWGRPDDLNKKGGGKNLTDYPFFKDSAFGTINQTGLTNETKKKSIHDEETNASKEGKAKESWMKSDTPGARFAKRIANAGIALANQSIASRMSLLNKTIGKIGGAAINNRILPPKNIYTDPFNGQSYTTSKIVKDAFTKFVGESISDLFKK